VLGSKRLLNEDQYWNSGREVFTQNSRTWGHSGHEK